MVDISLFICPPPRLELTEAGKERTRKRQNNPHLVSFICYRLGFVCFFAQVLTPLLCQHRKPRKLRKPSEGLRLGPEPPKHESCRVATVSDHPQNPASRGHGLPFSPCYFWPMLRLWFLCRFMVSEQEYFHCAYPLEWPWSLTLSMGNC